LLIFHIGPASEAANGRITFRSASTFGGRRVIFGKKTFVADQGEVTAVKVRLAGKKLKLLRRVKRARCKALIELRDAAGNESRETYRFTLTVLARRSG
jgi:hypothetical protein